LGNTRDILSSTPNIIGLLIYSLLSSLKDSEEEALEGVHLVEVTKVKNLEQAMGNLLPDLRVVRPPLLFASQREDSKTCQSVSNSPGHDLLMPFSHQLDPCANDLVLFDMFPRG
jgi:hypothetical protein